MGVGGWGGAVLCIQDDQLIPNLYPAVASNILTSLVVTIKTVFRYWEMASVENPGPVGKA